MNNKTSFEKYNIILILLFFIVPILALNLSYYILSNLNNNRLAKEQAKKAEQEVETLASEADFGKEFSMLFRDYISLIKKEAENTNKDNFLNYLEEKNNIIFKSPFPNYNLFVFKLTSENPESELIFYKGEVKKSGKKTLCKAFNILYSLNAGHIKIDEIKNNSFIKTLIGKNTNVDVIANEMRGITAHTNGVHSCSWFIWDYFQDKQNNVYGCILLSDDINDYAEKGRLLALERLKSRGFATGAFIPVYKDYGEANYLSPLDKSDTFLNWANNLTIQNEKDFYKWAINSLPQGESLGNYSAYCYLGRGSSHIAVILIKALKSFFWPKWLIYINFLTFLILFTIIFYGTVFGMWPHINLTIRFTLSYILASILPISLLSVTAFGYLIQYQYNSIDNAVSELLISLKALDSSKTDIVKEYRSTFSKAIEDSEFIRLIKENGIENESVAQRIIDIFEKSESGKFLPLLGVKIIDENGNGAIAKGSKPTNIEVEAVIQPFLSSQISILRNELNTAYPELKLGKFETNDEEKELANRAYVAITGKSIDYDLNRLFSFPIYRKNGDFCSYFMYDLIKIDERIRYMLFIVWDDKALDDSIIKQNFVNYNNIDIKQNFLAFRVKGQNVDYIAKKANNISKEFQDKLSEYAKQSAYSNKTATFVDQENIIAVTPSLNFSQTVFISWVDKNKITKDINIRKAVFIFLIIISLIILIICSLRSSSVFLKPISSLKEALDEVSSGNLNIGFKDSTKDELGQLSNEFSNMISELKEKERLSKLISDQAVQALQKHSNKVLDDTETFKGVALVSDIRNFTGMSEKYDPEIITELLNEHFAEMTKIISDKGGLIYKFIGDAIEAIFPENEDYNESASERAFKAGSIMISKLAVINNRRKKKDLFTYKIGVGLCYGIMYSGTVGSLDTRLDYSILGDSLKKAAKLEALSIQNPNFPLVTDENIAEKILSKYINLKKIVSKDNSFSAYVLEDIPNDIKVDFSEKSIENEKTNNKEKIKYFYISDLFKPNEKRKEFIINSIIVLFISIFITIGVNTVYNTKYNSLKNQSFKESSRLGQQLKSDELLKSIFDTLCFEFYEDINKILNSAEYNYLSFDQKIKKVDEKYEKLNIPIQKYCCCQYANDDPQNCNIKDISVKNFSNPFPKLLGDYAISLVTEKNKDDKIKMIMGNTFRDENMVTMHYRRSSLATIGKEELLINTDKIFSKDHNTLLSYIVCAMSPKLDKKELINYLPILAGNNLLLAITDHKNWYFSRSFPEKEKLFLQNSTNNKSIKNKGYYVIELELNNNKYTCYIITKELSNNNYSILLPNIFIFIISIFIFGSIIGIIRNRIFTLSSFVSSKLKLDIIISALLPLLTVCFLSYLYSNEDFNVKKSETISLLNKQIDEIERNQHYFNPLCESYFKKLNNSPDIKNYANIINSSNKNDRDNKIKEFSDYLVKNVSGNNSEIHKKLNKKYPLYSIREIIVIGKEGWISSAIASDAVDDKNNVNQGLSDFGIIISKVCKEIFFDKNKKNLDKTNNESFTAEMMTDMFVKALESVFGSDFCHKIINFPNNFITVFTSYSIIGFYVSAYPNVLNPDYIIISLVLYDIPALSDICNMKNDIVPYKQHLASGSVGKECYCFYSPNLKVGNSFFYEYDKIYDTGIILNNKREELKTVKELGLASSWINTSFLPVSRTVDLYGPHLLEARQGYLIKDNVFAALASEIPLRNEVYGTLKQLGFTILLLMLFIYIITIIVLSDLLAPVKRLIEGAISASKGNYKFRIEFNRGDELGALCDSFDKMMKGLEEKQLMNRMVSKSALKGASNLSDTYSKKIDAALLYVIVPDFDKIMKNMPTNELFSKLRQQITTISEIVIKNGGDIDKIMGEKLLIAFRADDKTPEEVARNASRVASLIETNDKLSFKVSVGVNYGQVISGYLGVGEKRDFTIIGDPVNVAARIAVFAEKLESNRLILSEKIMQLIKGSLETEEFGEVLFKGKNQPAKVYRLL